MRWGAWILLPTLICSGVAQDHAIPESKAKVDILLALPGYIAWPAGGGMDDKTRPFNIGMLGPSGLDASLIQACISRRVKGKPVVVRYARRIQDLTDCHMVFLRADDAQRLPEVMDFLKRQTVLTVADTPHFTSSGVMVNLVIEYRRIALVVNPSVMKRAGLEAGSQLLKLSQVVE